MLASFCTCPCTEILSDFMLYGSCHASINASPPAGGQAPARPHISHGTIHKIPLNSLTTKQYHVACRFMQTPNQENAREGIHANNNKSLGRHGISLTRDERPSPCAMTGMSSLDRYDTYTIICFYMCMESGGRHRRDIGYQHGNTKHHTIMVPYIGTFTQRPREWLANGIAVQANGH